MVLCADRYGFTAALGYSLPHQLAYSRPILPAITLVSIFWTAWDPTYSAFRKAQIQGRDVRIQGKTTYIVRLIRRSHFCEYADHYQVLQMLSWFSRLLTSALLAVTCFRPHQDHLNLSQGPTSYRSRIYFSISLALELSVCFPSIMCQYCPTNSSLHIDYFLFIFCSTTTTASLYSSP